MISSVHAGTSSFDQTPSFPVEKKFNSRKQMMLSILETGRTSFEQIQKNGLSNKSSSVSHADVSTHGHIDTYA